MAISLKIVLNHFKKLPNQTSYNAMLPEYREKYARAPISIVDQCNMKLNDDDEMTILNYGAWFQIQMYLYLLVVVNGELYFFVN